MATSTPIAVTRGQKLQIGKQASFDSLAAATFKYPGVWVMNEKRTFYEPDYPQGVRAQVSGQLVAVKDEVAGSIATDLTFEELITYLEACVKGSVAGVQTSVTGTANVAVTTSSGGLADSRAAFTVNQFIGGTVTCDSKTGVVTANTATAITVASWTGGTPTTGSAYTVTGPDYTWTFDLPFNADPGPNYLSLEFAPYDFTTAYPRKVPNVLLTDIAMKFPINDRCTLGANWFGGTAARTSVTSALANITAREIAKGNRTKFYLDETGAGLGGTQITGSYLPCDVMINGGLRPDWTGDGRATDDYGKYLFGDIAGTVKWSQEYGANAEAEFVKWLAGTPRFVRQKVTGGVIGSSSVAKSITIDSCIEYVKEPTISSANGNDIASFEGKMKYDTTWGHICKVVVICGLATFT